MFKRTPCYDCNRPERLPNGLCEMGCEIKAAYNAEKDEYNKKAQIERGLNSYTGAVIDRSKKHNRKFIRGGKDI